MISEESTEYLMSVEEVSAFLGLGRTYTYQLLTRGEIPSVRIGRLKKVRRTDVEKFVEKHTERSRRGTS